MQEQGHEREQELEPGRCSCAEATAAAAPAQRVFQEAEIGNSKTLCVPMQRNNAISFGGVSFIATSAIS